MEKYNLATHDNDLLKPDGEPANKARIAELQASQSALEAELVEHDAKNRLYQLLAVRTRSARPLAALQHCKPAAESCQRELLLLWCECTM